jgi:hypothetical protein
MCACEIGFTCDQCADTPLDDWYLENEREPPPEVFAKASDG